MIPLWSECARDSFATLPADTIAILPLGATEQHGPHLPYGVDTTLTEAVLSRVETHAQALQLPTLAITKSDEHSAVPGTLTLGVSTLLATLDDIAASVARTGIRRLAFFNGHGGNSAVLEIAARTARRAHGLITAHASWFAFADLSGFDATQLPYDLHAGDVETSAMLATRPDLVAMEKAQDFKTAMHMWEAAGHRTGLTGQPGRPGWIMEDLNRDGAAGNARAATADKGETLLQSAADGFARWLEDFARFDTAAAP